MLNMCTTITICCSKVPPEDRVATARPRAEATRPGPVAMSAYEGHIGPQPLEAGVVFSTKLADRIFRETGVRANYRARNQWGKGKN